MGIIASASPWDARDDRKIYAVWLAMIWMGMIAGFGLDFPRYLREKPPPLPLVHFHAVVFVSWLVFLTAQITLILNGRFVTHRRLGILGAGLASLMLILGPATALTTKARALLLGHGDPQFLAVNFVDIIGFGLLVSAGLVLRNRPSAHKRLMIFATVSLADPGFARLSGAVLPDTANFWLWFAEVFYGNILLIGAMAAWDLWRRGRLHPAFIAGASLLLAAEFGATLLYFDPAWKTIATSIVKAWGYAG